MFSYFKYLYKYYQLRGWRNKNIWGAKESQPPVLTPLGWYRHQREIRMWIQVAKDIKLKSNSHQLRITPVYAINNYKHLNASRRKLKN